MARSLDFSHFIEVDEEEAMTCPGYEGSEEIMESIENPVSLSLTDYYYD